MTDECTCTSAAREFLERRRAMAGLAGFALLGGCGMVQKSPFFSTIATFNRSPVARIDRKKVDSIPYASMMAWFDGDARSLLILGEYLPEDRLVWYSAEQQAVTTWGPFALALIGTNVALRATTLSGTWSKDVREMVGRTVERALEFQSEGRSTIVVSKSKFESQGVGAIKVFDQNTPLLHIQEHVTADKWHKYTNDYWVDSQSGRWWKARQHVVPTMKPLNFELVKPPQRG